MKRVFLIVLDSLGIGEAPDADKFSDIGANTLKRISASKKFNIPNLIKLGLGEIDGVEYLKKNPEHIASVARLREISMGKDTTIGHWEIAGVVSPSPLPTYPDGFPEEIIDAFEKAIGKGTLCNKPYSGTEVIKQYGEEHKKTGKLIVYTSADSVFQIAAHEDVVPVEELYAICRTARKILIGKHAVGRVIARPFIDGKDGFVRTANRRDFSVEPPEETLLDAIKAAGLDSISVGKISDIFAARGITESYLTHGNREAMQITDELLDKNFHGLCFINLVDFDMLFGHRQDVDGYASALREFDTWLESFLQKLKEDDMLIITADHGCDPGDDSTDHTREYVPLLVYGKNLPAENFGTKTGFGTVANLISRSLNIDYFSKKCDKIDIKQSKMQI